MTSVKHQVNVNVNKRIFVAMVTSLETSFSAEIERKTIATLFFF